MTDEDAQKEIDKIMREWEEEMRSSYEKIETMMLDNTLRQLKQREHASKCNLICVITAAICLPIMLIAFYVGGKL